MKIIVFDDDPTGSQTVRQCPLILNWEYSTLLNAFQEQSNLIFILANTRSLSPDLAEKRLRQICKSLHDFFLREGLSKEDFIFVSRGDSTLRGHGFLEPDLINKELGSFDATFHIPAFFEGARTTKNGVHFLKGVPVHRSDFAQDKIFGYSTSDLANWLEEKSKGALVSEDVFNLNVSRLDLALEGDEGFRNLVDLISSFNSNQLVTVDALKTEHLDIFVRAINSSGRAKRFLFRSAASLINSLSGISSTSDFKLDIYTLRLKNDNLEFKPGLIVVGSYVDLSSKQLSFILEDNRCVGIELNVQKFHDTVYMMSSETIESDFAREILELIRYALASGRTPILYTSREEKLFNSSTYRLSFGNRIADFMAFLVDKLSPELGYIISKGGITTHAILEKGLNANKVTLEGQIMPGLSLVTSSLSNKKTKLPVVTFPGNLGGENSLFKAWRIMESVFD